MSRLLTRSLWLSLLAFNFLDSRLVAETTSPDFSAADLEFFEKDVRPILVARCNECHSSDVKEPKGGLRTDSRSSLMAGGDTGPAIVPGHPEKSLLIDAINYGDTYQMPPKSRLPAAEVAILTKWVERGAPWPKESPTTKTRHEGFDLAARQSEHWCWKPVKASSAPVVKSSQWPLQELDRFVLAKLEEKGIQPAAAAPKHELARRLFFDLIGLPPTPEQLESFLQDNSPQAYEKLVDRLLESPHFGERWARHWMDLVRYAETCGHEFDYPIHNAWQYRDYLIRAFNADLPYDQLVIEHIAGDLLSNPRLHPTEKFNESILGTTFWWLHEAIHAPVDVRTDQAGRIDNQIDVFSKTFLGLTVACARCHDHKFDAISTKDYYALAGFLGSTRRQEAILDPNGRIHEVAEQTRAIREESNHHLRRWLQERLSSLSVEKIEKLLLASHAARPLKTAAATSEAKPAADLEAIASKFEIALQDLLRWTEAISRAVEEGRDQPLALWSSLSLAQSDQAIAAKLSELREKTKRPATKSTGTADWSVFADFTGKSGFGDWFASGEAFGAAPTGHAEWEQTSVPPQLVKPGVAHSGQLSPKLQGVLRSPTFTLSSRNIWYRMAGRDCEVRLIVDGYTMIEFHQLLFGGCKFAVNTDGKWVWHRQAGDLGMYLGHQAYIEVIDHGDGWVAIDEICFSDQDSPPPTQSKTRFDNVVLDPSADSLPALARLLAQEVSASLRRWNTPEELDDDRRLVNWLLAHDLLSTGQPNGIASILTASASRLADAAHDLSPPRRVVAATDGTGVNERIFIRGNPKVLGEEAPRQLLTALVGTQPPVTQGSGRLILARQVADPANPLTARVMVNRIWHHMFGTGIVPTTDNFGVLGEVPTNPELLDHLAHQFVLDGWSIKRLIRSLALSRTYQMSSAPSPSADEVDPNNRLWHRANIRRLEGEAIRDAMLSISGQLDPQPFGPSVPVHITPFMQGRGRPGSSGPLDGARRRSLYQEVRRNFLPPMMLAFDAPIPFNTVGRRNVSNVPAQALILMNDPFVVDQAKHWAERLVKEKPDFEQRLRHAYVAALGRGPSEVERAAVDEFLKQQAREHQIAPEQVRDSVVLWSDLCHVLFNLKEFSFLN